MVSGVGAPGGDLPWTELAELGRGRGLAPMRVCDWSGRTEYHRPVQLQLQVRQLPLTLCSAGVDSLYVSFAGTVDVRLLGHLEELRLQAQADGAPVLLPAGERRMIVHANGSGHYRYWLHCSDFQVLVAQGRMLPPVYLKLSSAYLHQLGPIAALRDAETFVRATLTGQLAPPQASRVDLYADFQGWIPNEQDFRRVVTRARRSAQHFDSVRAYFDGPRFTGYQFGRDQLVARLYDKGREAAESGNEAWMREVWGPRLDPTVFRVAPRVSTQA